MAADFEPYDVASELEGCLDMLDGVIEVLSKMADLLDNAVLELEEGE